MLSDKVSPSLFVDSTNYTGIRIKKLEYYNWSGFDGFRDMLVDRQSFFICGLNGSGKSTLLDGLKFIFQSNPSLNDASENKGSSVKRDADSGAVEGRTLGTCVVGKYGTIQDPETGVDRPKVRRSVRDISMVSCVFSDMLGNCFTALAVFYYPDSVPEVKVSIATPEKRWFIFPYELGIYDDLLYRYDSPGVLINFAVISKALRSFDNAMYFTTFSKYALELSSRLHIPMEALSHIVNTISTRSLSNIDLFIRERALGAFPAKELLPEFREKLKGIRDLREVILVSEAKRQRLGPIVESIGSYNSKLSVLENLKRLHANCGTWIDMQMLPLYKDKLEFDLDEICRLSADVSKMEARISEINLERDELLKLLGSQGDSERKSLEKEIDSLTKQQASLNANYTNLCTLLAKLGLNKPKSEEDFESVRSSLVELRSGFDDQVAELSNEDITLRHENVDNDVKLERLRESLQFLRKNKGNISPNLLYIRAKVSNVTGIPESELPFIGELLEVKDEEKEDWEGPINKLMKGFASTMLVPSKYYLSVYKFLNGNIKDWLPSYYDPSIDYIPVYDLRYASSEEVGKSAEYVSGKLLVRTDSPMSEYVRQEVISRFHCLCVDSISTVPKGCFAIERSGQFRRKKDRHTKNDRKDINDYSWYVIGFSGERKIMQLEEEIASLLKSMKDREIRIKAVKGQLNLLKDKLSYTSNALSYRSWASVDYFSVSVSLKGKKEELRLFLDQHKGLDSLNNRIVSLDVELKRCNKMIVEDNRKSSELDSECRLLEERLDVLEKVDFGLISEEDSADFKRYAVDCLKTEAFSFDNEKKLRDYFAKLFDSLIASHTTKITQFAHKLENLFDSYLQDFPDDRSYDLTSSIHSRESYVELYSKLEKDNLSSSVELNERFKSTILNDLMVFYDNLESLSHSITDVIDRLNDKLRQVWFTTVQGKKCHLRIQQRLKEKGVTADFRKDVKKVIKDVSFDVNTLNKQDADHILRLVENLVAEKNAVKQERMENITDVRNWYSFSLDLLDENDVVVDHYKSTLSASTGTAEAMAAFIMLVSLANVYGLFSSNGHESFRLVMMDEVFRNNSNDKVRRVFELLRELDFQLIFVAPEPKNGVVLRNVQAVYQVYVDDNDPEGREVSYICKHDLKEYKEALESDESAG